MTVDDRKQVDRKFLRGEISILFATESYESGVENPNVSQVIRIGCPRNLGYCFKKWGEQVEGLVQRQTESYYSKSLLMTKG